MTTTQTTQSLAILGPNLANEHKTGIRFIIHDAGCRDVKRDEMRNHVHPAERWVAPWSNQASVIDSMYDFLGGEMSEDGDPTWPSDRPEYVAEFNFCPCVKIPLDSRETV